MHKRDRNRGNHNDQPHNRAIAAEIPPVLKSDVRLVPVIVTFISVTPLLQEVTVHKEGCCKCRPLHDISHKRFQCIQSGGNSKLQKGHPSCRTDPPERNDS